MTTEDKVFSYAERLRTMTKTKSFIGKEFLTWLWFLSESSEDFFEVTTPDGDISYSISCWIDDRVTLESPSTKAHVHNLRGGDPSQSEEAAAALRSGKMVKELKMGLHITGFGETTFNLSSDDVTPRSIQWMEADEQTQSNYEGVSSLAIRLKQVEAIGHILDGLFARFMKEFLEAKKPEDFRAVINSWIEQRSQTDSRPLIN